MEYYHRDGSEYKELENHSDALQGMDKFTTSTTVISGPDYNYVREMMTPAFYKNHLIDTTTISGPDHIYYKSVKNMFQRHYDETVEFLKENNPNYLQQLLNEEETHSRRANNNNNDRQEEGSEDYHHHRRLRR